MTPYCLEHYTEVKYIRYCNELFQKYNDKYKTCNYICIKAFQAFKMLIDNVNKLSIPMELTYEVLNTQVYDKVDDYTTLQYNDTNCRLEEYVETYRSI